MLLVGPIVMAIPIFSLFYQVQAQQFFQFCIDPMAYPERLSISHMCNSSALVPKSRRNISARILDDNISANILKILKILILSLYHTIVWLCNINGLKFSTKYSIKRNSSLNPIVLLYFPISPYLYILSANCESLSLTPWK